MGPSVDPADPSERRAAARRKGSSFASAAAVAAASAVVSEVSMRSARYQSHASDGSRHFPRHSAYSGTASPWLANWFVTMVTIEYRTASWGFSGFR